MKHTLAALACVALFFVGLSAPLHADDANVGWLTRAGLRMMSNQALLTTSSPTFAGLTLNNGTATGIVALPDGSIVMGGQVLVPIGSLTGVSIGSIGDHTTRLHKTAHGLNLFQGDLIVVTSCTTSTNRGIFTYVGIESGLPDDIDIDYVMTGSDVDIALTAYRYVVSIDSKGQYRSMTTVHSINDRPMMINYEVDVLDAVSGTRGLEIFFGSHTDNWGSGQTTHYPFKIYRYFYLGKDIFRVDALGNTYTLADFQTDARVVIGTNLILSKSGSRYLRLGTDAASPLGQAIIGASGVGTNIKGGDFTFSAGLSTGTNTGGTIYFNTTRPGATSSSSANAATTPFRMTDQGVTVGAGDATLYERAYCYRIVADAVIQPWAVVMADAGTDGRFDVNAAGSTLPIGVYVGTGVTAADSYYSIGTHGVTYLIPAEDVVAVTRGHVLYVDDTNAGCVDDNASLQAAGLNVGVSLMSEAAVTFNGADDVDPAANTIVLDSAPGWAVNDPVIFWDSGDTAPTGMTDGKVYWIKSISSATVTLTDARSGTVLDITGDGSGTTMYLMRLPLAALRLQ